VTDRSLQPTRRRQGSWLSCEGEPLSAALEWLLDHEEHFYSEVGSMLKRLCLLQIVLLLTAGTIVAQRSFDLQSKFGPPQDAFVIRPGLLMTAKYAADEKVCEMYIVEAQTPRSNIGLRTPLTPETVPGLIDELVPEGERGRKLRWPVQTQGMTLQVVYKFENVSIELIQNLLPAKGWSDSILKIKWANRVCK